MSINFDLKATLDEMLNSAKKTAGDGGKDAKGIAAKFLKNRKERLELLAELRLSGDLPDDKFTSRLDDEKLILEAELLALAVISKATAQKTAKSVIGVFQNAVLNALPDVLKTP